MMGGWVRPDRSSKDKGTKDLRRLCVTIVIGSNLEAVLLDLLNSGPAVLRTSLQWTQGQSALREGACAHLTLECGTIDQCGGCGGWRTNASSGSCASQPI